MENNIEEPLTTDEIIYHANISRHQLERLFKKYLTSVPSRYYLRIRLEKARARLLSSNKSIADIGLSCGFSSGAHFSTAYRNQYGLTPSEDRSLHLKMPVTK
jgi:transcriptional regulator GlxA family with amidase domain